VALAGAASWLRMRDLFVELMGHCRSGAYRSLSRLQRRASRAVTWRDIVATALTVAIASGQGHETALAPVLPGDSERKFARARDCGADALSSTSKIPSRAAKGGRRAHVAGLIDPDPKRAWLFGRSH